MTNLGFHYCLQQRLIKGVQGSVSGPRNRARQRADDQADGQGIRLKLGQVRLLLGLRAANAVFHLLLNCPSATNRSPGSSYIAVAGVQAQRECIRPRDRSLYQAGAGEAFAWVRSS